MQRDQDKTKTGRVIARNNIAEELEDSGYPVNFPSLDGKVRCTAAQISFGARLFNQYRTTHNPITLNQACEQNWHDALIERTELNCAIIKNDEISEHKKEEAKQLLLHDLEMLCLHYWSVGCIHASRVLLDIGNYYDSKQPGTGEENPFAADAHAYWEKAAAYFFRAKLLAVEETSKYLARILYQGDDISPSGYHTWDEAETALLNPDHVDFKRQSKLEQDESVTIKTIQQRK